MFDMWLIKIIILVDVRELCGGERKLLKSFYREIWSVTFLEDRKLLNDSLKFV